MLGDGVWEGIRLHRGVLMFIEAHLGRLYEGAKAVDMNIDLDPQALQSLIYDACDANGMAQASGEGCMGRSIKGLSPGICGWLSPHP